MSDYMLNRYDLHTNYTTPKISQNTVSLSHFPMLEQIFDTMF